MKFRIFARIPMKKISVITPSFNQGKFLEETINSVLSQGYDNLEYIIIDGGSTDESVNIIKKYEKHLAYWVSEKDNGQSDAVNKGIRTATGEIIAWLNSDDCYLPGTLKKIDQYFSDDNILVVSGKGNVLKNNLIVGRNPGVDIYPSIEKTIGWARIDQPETFFRSSSVKEIGLLNTNLHYVMDREWWIRYLLLFGQENVRKVEDYFVNFRLHDQSKTWKDNHLFEKEANDVYYTMAVLNDLPEANMFSRNFNVQLIPSLQHKKTVDKNLLTKVIYYFWLFQARLLYASDDLKGAQKYLDIINDNFLEEGDKAEFNLLKKRAAWLPVWLKKLLNKRSS